MASVALAALKRRRGAVKASIPKLTTKIAKLEARDSDSSVPTHAQQCAKRLENLNSDFKTRHFAIIDVLEDEEQLAGEQDILDKHDDELADLHLRLQAMMITVTTPSPAPTSPSAASPLPNHGILERRSAQLQARLVSVHEKIGHLKDDGSDIHLIY